METQLSQRDSDNALDLEHLLGACQSGDASAWEVLIDRSNVWCSPSPSAKG